MNGTGRENESAFGFEVLHAALAPGTGEMSRKIGRGAAQCHRGLEDVVIVADGAAQVIAPWRRFTATAPGEMTRGR